MNNGKIICLIGPSGSGKTAIADELVKDCRFAKPVTATTRNRRCGEPERAYHFISENKFEDMLNNNEFLETTVYNGCHYGTPIKEIDKIIKFSKNAVIPIDINGAVFIKKRYKDNSILVFIQRDKQKLIEEILKRNVSNEEKCNRISSIDSECENASLCDTLIYNNYTLEEAAKKIKSLL